MRVRRPSRAGAFRRGGRIVASASGAVNPCGERPGRRRSNNAVEGEMPRRGDVGPIAPSKTIGGSWHAANLRLSGGAQRCPFAAAGYEPSPRAIEADSPIRCQLPGSVGETLYFHFGSVASTFPISVSSVRHIPVMPCAGNPPGAHS